MKKIIVSLFVLALIGCYSVRVWSINQNVPLPPVYTYKIGEEVAIENDIFLDAYENMNGYTVTVDEATILSIDDFIDKYDAYNRLEEWEGDITEMVYDLTITIKNTNVMDDPLDDFNGMQLIHYNLIATNFTLSYNSELFQMANPDLAELDMMSSFKLRPESEMQLHVPFPFSPNSQLKSSVETIKNNDLYLYVSLYPNEKRILIHE
ncbi:DUF5028 domain-containing protein [Bacillus sp. JCM 19034]|uniref:DUF5028 domain-containing protein n=1 Tax=Bacillus sp. JCM 19034 TaxID=1481928 RepID=UPI000782CF13|nr:DUF5028 domain-containing protein [Bacillus sp. JCM 19034]